MNQPEPHHPPPVIPRRERPDRDPGHWPDYPEQRHYPPFRRHLPYFQPGIRFPQAPGAGDWDDDLTAV